MRVYDNQLELWNPGELPEELTIDKLKEDHSSYPRNPNMAGVFFKAGYIESWGRGTNRIIEALTEAGFPEPVIEEDMKGLRITFQKDIYTEQYLAGLGLGENFRKALLFIKENGSITNTQYQNLLRVSKRTATRELQELIEEGWIDKMGTTGKGTAYVFRRREVSGP